MLQRFALLIVALVFVQALAGGLVAGIRAGFAYNTFPLMNGRVVPPEILSLTPWYRNFADNMATVQFDHRMIAWLLALLSPRLLVSRSPARAAARQTGGRPAAGWRCRCSLRWASRRCCWSCLFRSPPRIRRAPCCCSPRRSMPRMRCAFQAPASSNAHEQVGNAHERICILPLQGGS